MKRLIARLRAAFHEPSTRIYRVVQGTVWGLILALSCCPVIRSAVSTASQ